MKHRKHMKKVREKKINSLQKQIDEHQEKIENEKGELDTTKDYWKNEIEGKFKKQKQEAEKYLEEH